MTRDANDVLREGGPDALREAIDKAPRQTPNAQGKAKDAARPVELVRLDLTPYDSAPIPPREWGVPGRFPRRNVVLLSGQGGAGKSILLLQLAVAHVLGRDWLRSLPEPGPVIVVNCEDEPGELVRRLKPILDHYQTTFADVAKDLHIFPLAEVADGNDASNQVLATAGRDGVMQVTALYHALMMRVREVRPVCIVIDNVADVFGGSEIDRSQVRQFIALVRRLAVAANGYCILSAHPSLTGIASKSGLSGSTAWHNSVRARAYLRGATDKTNADDNGEAAPNTRVLEFQKSNYSSLAECLELRWADGLYLPVATPSAPEQAAARAAADALFLQLLEKHERKGDHVSPKRTANNFAATVFAKTTEAKAAHVSRQHFEDAQDRLTATDQIAVETYGPPSRRGTRLVRRQGLV